MPSELWCDQKHVYNTGLNGTALRELFVYNYTQIVFVRLSVTGGRFDPETQEAVSLAIERKKLELGDLCEWQRWH